MGDTSGPAARRWYEHWLVAFLAGYVFAPLGIYLMWRYQPWPLWVKSALTIFGLVAMVAGTYISTRYVHVV